MSQCHLQGHWDDAVSFSRSLRCRSVIFKVTEMSSVSFSRLLRCHQCYFQGRWDVVSVIFKVAEMPSVTFKVTEMSSVIFKVAEMPSVIFKVAEMSSVLFSRSLRCRQLHSRSLRCRQLFSRLLRWQINIVSCSIYNQIKSPVLVSFVLDALHKLMDAYF